MIYLVLTPPALALNRNWLVESLIRIGGDLEFKVRTFGIMGAKIRGRVCWYSGKRVQIAHQNFVYNRTAVSLIEITTHSIRMS